jgi:hypothetical protein
MSPTTFGWLVLLFPLLGTVGDRPRLQPPEPALAGLDRHAAIALAFAARSAR